MKQTIVSLKRHFECYEDWLWRPEEWRCSLGIRHSKYCKSIKAVLNSRPSRSERLRLQIHFVGAACQASSLVQNVDHLCLFKKQHRFTYSITHNSIFIHTSQQAVGFVLLNHFENLEKGLPPSHSLFIVRALILNYFKNLIASRLELTKIMNRIKIAMSGKSQPSHFLKLFRPSVVVFLWPWTTADLLGNIQKLPACCNQRCMGGKLLFGPVSGADITAQYLTVS